MLFQQVLATLLGSILVVQILAHTPLTDIHLPANLLQTYQIMLSFVSFDYFPPFEYIEVDFTEVWSWSPQFEFIGYDTVNFLLGLGSIAVFAALQLCTVLVSLAMRICRVTCPCKWGRENFAPAAVWITSLTFIHGTFFEISVCAFISLSMVPFVSWEDLLNSSDNASCGFALLFGIIMVLYVLFVNYFVCCKSRKLEEYY